MNITTTNNGFIFNDVEYVFNNEFEINSPNDCHIMTNNGTIYFNLTCTINNITYNDINNFVNALIKE
jgi:hypothetical protein